MCKWGIDEEITLCEPTPIQKRIRVKVDSCIAPLVQMLNDYGIKTISSCCGHSKDRGRIDLADGNLIWIPLKEKPDEDHKV